MNSIIWKGVSSTTIKGLIICELPPITKPELRVKETEIDGRDGSIFEDLGYSSYNKTLTIGLVGDYDINAVIKYFTGEGDIVFSNEPEKVYRAKIFKEIDYDRLLRFRKAKITFRMQPFKYKLNEVLKETPTEVIQGTSIVTSNNADEILKSFKIYGKSTQNGTPSPDAPIDMVSVGDDGSITVSANGQNIVVQTPNSLCGIPVSQNGNYTDANGQQWICDEIDIARGVYVQRTYVKTLNGLEGWNVTKLATGISIFINYDNNGGYYIKQNGLSSVGYVPYIQLDNGGYGLTYAYGYRLRFENINPDNNTVDELKAYLSANPINIIILREVPIETPLTEEEIAQYSSLISIEPNIAITNDENAHMMVEYFKPFEVFNEGLENSKPLMILKGSGTVEISVNGVGVFSYTFPDGENEVIIDSEKEDAYLGDVLKNRNMNGEFPILIPKTNKIEWSGDIESISILPRSRWL